jgi:CAAX prenyl protease-like protein
VSETTTTTTKFWKNCAAFAAPFVTFMVCSLFESSELSSAQYQVRYTAKLILVVAVMWGFRRHYPKISTAGFRWATVGGVCGFALWIGLAKLQAAIPGLQERIDAILAGGRVAYVPDFGEDNSLTTLLFVLVRLTGLALVVPLMEELFWRGFLARFLISHEFELVPFGRFTRGSFLIVTLAFTAVHPEVLPAIAWGATINLLCWKTRNLWACCAMHAITNGLLGAYILATRSWELW